MAGDWPAHAIAIAGYSYGAAGAAFLVLFLLLLAGERGHRHVAALGWACALTAAWAAQAAWSGASGGSPHSAALLLETIRTGAWLLCLLWLLEGEWRRRRGLMLLLAIPLAASSLQLGAGFLPMPEWRAISIAIAARLSLAVLGMLMVEHLYRGTPLRERWGIKFACLGIGALFAYDFYLYSDAMLFRQVNGELWAARGAVNALSVPLLAVAAARKPAWTPGLLLSRQIMFGSAALLGSALYLLAMAASAWYLRYIGGAWGAVMQLACLFGAVLLLAGVLFSGAMRARLKVFISKHFYRSSFDYREEWMRLTRALSEDGPELAELAERSIRALAALVESPAGALWIQREGASYQPAGHWNMPPQSAVEADDACCRFMQQRAWVIDVPDCRAHPERYDGLVVPDWLARVPDAWLLAPMMLHGRLFGFACLARPRTRMALDWELTDVLKIAGSQAASYLAHRESANHLMVARQFESFNRMSAFVVHDLKNLVSQLSLLLANAERHQANPAFQKDMLATLAHSVGKMNALLARLNRGDANEQDLPAPLALETLLRQVVRDHALLRPRPRLEPGASGVMVQANWSRLERVLGHLLQNAAEATAPDGDITLRLLRTGGEAVIELRDTGAGMSPEFIRDHLFQPFASTKASGMGIGVFESRETIRVAGGRLEVCSTEGAGTTFRIVLPLMETTGVQYGQA
jgi:putative PEP-CTERM system histidine kinase